MAFDLTIFPRRARRPMLAAALLAGAALAGAAMAQDSAPPAVDSTSMLDLPKNPTLFGTSLPQVIKASVIVNGQVITQTDIDQRLALLAIANGSAVQGEELERLRQQVLRNLIDETLQIQAAKTEEIDVTDQDIDRAVTRLAGNVKQTPEEMAAYLAANGSSIRSIRQQIKGELAWRRLQSAKIGDSVNVGDDEVKAVIDKLQASKGTEEYRVGEIFLTANPANKAEVFANGQKLLEALKQGGSFVAFARQYSEASTAAVGGDLGWVRPEQLPGPLETAIKEMKPGMVSPPIEVPGGFSILALQDTRKVLTADPRNAVLNVKQVSVGFPAGASRAQSEALLAKFFEASRSIGGCGGAEKLATDFNGEVVQSDEVKLRELPPTLQEMMLPMQVGQVTRPFGSFEEGIRVLVLCGRDEVETGLPSYDQVYAQLNEERMNMRARRYLRDLRRDAVIDFR